MSTPFTISHPLGRPPTFPELQALAKQYEVQIVGDEQSGSFWQPNQEKPKANGKYAIEKTGEFHGEFTSHVLGKTTGTCVLMAGKAEITITAKPFFLPESILKSNILEPLKVFCAKFPSAI